MSEQQKPETTDDQLDELLARASAAMLQRLAETIDVEARLQEVLRLVRDDQRAEGAG